MKKTGLGVVFIIVVALLTYTMLSKPTREFENRSDAEISEVNALEQNSVVADQEVSDFLTLTLLATSVNDAKAVFKRNDFVSSALSVGDLIPESKLRLVQVASDKVVLQDTADQRLMLLYLADKNGVSKRQRFTALDGIDSPQLIIPLGM